VVAARMTTATTAITIKAIEWVGSPVLLRQRWVDGGACDVHVWREGHDDGIQPLRLHEGGGEGGNEVDRSSDGARVSAYRGTRNGSKDGHACQRVVALAAVPARALAAAAAAKAAVVGVPAVESVGALVTAAKEGMPVEGRRRAIGVVPTTVPMGVLAAMPVAVEVTKMMSMTSDG
jgi:hypothetical protein